MNQVKNIPVQLIENYLSFIKGLSNEEIIKLIKNEAAVRFKIFYSSEKNNFKKNSETLNRFVDLDLIISNLYKINNREEGDKYLSSKCSTKTEFESVARKLDVPFQRKDSIEKLKYKIIERTIGFRIRSQAIQGEKI